MENKKYELDKVLIDINSNSDTKDNNISTYIYNYTRILEAFIKDINDLKNKDCSKIGAYSATLEEFDIIDKFKKLVISEMDRCVILNRLASSPISDTKNNKENTVKENVISNNAMDLNELINKITSNKITHNKYNDTNKDDNNATKRKVNEPIKPKTIRPKKDHKNINKVNLNSACRICRNSDPSDDFESVVEAFNSIMKIFEEYNDANVW